MSFGLLVLLVEAALAALALDLFFRHGPIGWLSRRRSSIGVIYGTVGALGTAVGVGLAWRVSGSAAAIAGAGSLVWWALWRFGRRKQFPHLYGPGKGE